MGGEQHLSPQKGRDAGILYDVVVVAGKYSQPDSLWSIEDGIGGSALHMGADEGVKLSVRMNGAVAERYGIGVVELASSESSIKPAPWSCHIGAKGSFRY